MPSIDVLPSVAAWLLPVVDPAAPDWQAGWLTTPPWYIRAYTWMLLLSPLVLAAARRWQIGLPIAMAAFVVAEATAAAGLISGTERVMVGDLVTYGVFAIIGAAWASASAPTWTASDRKIFALIAATASLGAVGWAMTVQASVVSKSYPLTMFAVVAWIAAAGAFEPSLRRVAAFGASPRADRLTDDHHLSLASGGNRCRLDGGR